MTEGALFEEEELIGGRRTKINNPIAVASNDELFATRVGASAALGQALHNTCIERYGSHITGIYLAM